MKLFSFTKRQRPEPVPEEFPALSDIDEKGLEILKSLKGMRMCDAEQALFGAHNVLLHWHEMAPFACLPPSMSLAPTSTTKAAPGDVKPASEEGRSITVVRKPDGWTLIEIGDTALHISPDELERLKPLLTGSPL